MALYQSELRKPVYAVFCLDYSGSMYGSGNESLVSAMEYILTQEEAEKDLLQFTEKDKIAVVPFSSGVIATWYAENGYDTDNLIQLIKNEEPNGSTDIYGASIQALNILNSVDTTEYNVSVILMTDGAANVGTFRDLERYYNSNGKEIPIYSIMFGSAYANQLEGIAEMSNAKVFDGRTDLLNAFKEVRGYN